MKQPQLWISSMNKQFKMPLISTGRPMEISHSLLLPTDSQLLRMPIKLLSLLMESLLRWETIMNFSTSIQRVLMLSLLPNRLHLKEKLMDKERLDSMTTKINLPPLVKALVRLQVLLLLERVMMLCMLKCLKELTRMMRRNKRGLKNYWHHSKNNRIS